MEPLITEILLVSNLLSNCMFKAFSWCTYITVSYLNWPRSGKLSKFEVWEKCLHYGDLRSKTYLFQTLFLDFGLTAYHFLATWWRKDLYASKEGFTTCWKKVWNWKIEEWEANKHFLKIRNEQREVKDFTAGNNHAKKVYLVTYRKVNLVQAIIEWPHSKFHVTT